MIFSLAGMPLTAGFMSKFYVLLIGVANSQWLLLWILIINSAIGLYYYLKVVFFIFKPVPENQNKESALVPVGSSIVLAISLMMIIWIGVVPNELIKDNIFNLQIICLYSKYFLDITLTGIHEVINPINDTVTNTIIISLIKIFTG